MKFMITCIFLLLLSGCARKFIFATDERVAEYGKLSPFKFDSTYDLYVRQIVKTFDSATRLYMPGNGILDTAKNELIELEFLLINKNNHDILVINNIANKRKIFYNNSFKQQELAPSDGITKMDIWYFSQFRFGRDSSGDFVFENVENEGFNHRWEVSFKNDTAFLEAIGVYDKFGEDTRNANEAFAFPVYFLKVKDFTFFIKDYAAYNRNKELPEFEPVEKTIYLAGEGKKSKIIFRFNTAIRGNFKNIVFDADRLYAAPKLPK